MLAALALTAHAASLSRTLERVLDDPALAGASVSVVVLDAEGDVRYARDPDRRLVPASTVKWVVAVAAARELGLDFTFETAVAVTGAREGTVLHGDLVLVGSGDPSLGDPDPSGVLAAVAAALHVEGIDRITGDVVVDDAAFAGPPLGPGWMWDDLALPYSAPIAAANLAHNLRVTGLDRCEARGGPGSPLVDPPLCLAETVRAALAAQGVAVDGQARRGSAPEAVPIAVLRSPPLAELLRHMLVTSDNLYAECVARALDRDPPAEPAAAREQLERLLAEVGVEAHLVDGSGLSRYSLASGEALARLALWAAAQPFGEPLLALLPVAGRDGTLAGRALDTPAEGRVRGKTGSMTGVRNLVGFVEDGRGERLAFAFLINGLARPQAEAIAVQDRALAVLALSRGGRVRRRDLAALGLAGS